MRSCTSGVASMISTAGTRPFLPLRGSRRCAIIARRFSERSISNCWRFSSGKKLMMRSMAWFELLACSVARHRWPVSAYWMAYSIVSRSRISPIRITSGAWRSVFFSATCHDSVSTPTSRCVTTQFWCACTYSTGSSIVMIWPYELALRCPTMAASEVDLPEPVAPTTITRPRLLITMSLRIGGRSSSSSEGIFVLMVRSTMPARPCCTKADTRKRPAPGAVMAKLHSRVCSYSRSCFSFMIALTRLMACVAFNGCCEIGVTLPSTLMAGGKSDVMNKSEPRLFTINCRSSWMYLVAASRSSMACPSLKSVSGRRSDRQCVSSRTRRGSWRWRAHPRS